MTRFGYTLMTEQNGPKDLVQNAISAERRGFDFEVASDHFSPWLTSQGHAPNAWAVLGAVAQVTDRVDLYHLRDLPDHALSPGDRRAAGGDGADPRRRAVHPGPGQRREPQRARGRQGLAGGHAAAGHAARGDRDHSPPVRRRPGRLAGRLLPGGLRATVGPARCPGRASVWPWAARRRSTSSACSPTI